MRKQFVIFLLIFVCPVLCSAGENDFCVWIHLCVKKDVRNQWSLGAFTEGRTRDFSVDQFYVRPFVAYHPVKGLQIKMQADFAATKPGFNLRLLPEVSYKYSMGDFAFSLRQRLMATWAQSSGNWKVLLRTKGTVEYSIPRSPLSLSAAVEPFYLKKFVRCRYYSGLKIDTAPRRSVTIQYVRQQFFSGHANENILWLMYTITL